MPYPNEHACRINEPSKYKNFARKALGKGLDAIIGIKSPGSSEIQAYRYNKKIWDEKRAQKHCQSQGGQFEAAKTI